MKLVCKCNKELSVEQIGDNGFVYCDTCKVSYSITKLDEAELEDRVEETLAGSVWGDRPC